MPRTDLSSLLQKIDVDDVEPIEKVAAPAKPGVATAPSLTADVQPQDRPDVSAKRQGSRTKKAPAEATPPPSSEPLYRTLVRKEARLREEQYATLTEYARKLNRAKGPEGMGERITENTLIRIAIDLLIPHLNELKGNYERELRESVTNRL